MHDLLIRIVVGLFWLSFAAIGAALLTVLSRHRRFASLLAFIRSMPIFAQLFVLFAAGFTALAPWIILGFIFGLPTVMLSSVYVLSLLATAIVGWRCRRSLFARLASLHPSLNWVYAGMAALACVLVADYALAHFIGANIANGNDAYVHMGKIEQLAHGSLTLADPYFNGSIESRYHVNVVHSLYAVGMQVTGLQVLPFWDNSYPMFRLMCWLGVFLVAWYFAPVRNKRLFAIGATLASMPLLVSFFSIANYPNVIVLTWLCLWLIGFSRFVSGKEPWLMLAGALLAAMSHPAYSAGAAGFTVLFIVYFGLFERQWWTTAKLKTVIVMVSIFLLPTIVTLLYPNRLSQATLDYGQVPTISLGSGLEILKPVVYTADLRLFAIGALSIVGYLAIIWSRKARQDRALLALLVVYMALLAYNPVISLLAGDQLPPWLIDRFKYINRLGPIAAWAGIIALTGWVGAHIKQKKWSIPVQVVLIAIAMMPIVFIGTTNGRQYLHIRGENIRQTVVMDSLDDIEPLLHDQRVFALKGDSFILPAVTTLGVISMPDTNASPVANIAQRQACSDFLSHTLDQNALETAGVTRVLVGAWEPELMNLAKSKPYLHIVGGNGTFLVFGVDQQSKHATIRVCDIPDGQ